MTDSRAASPAAASALPESALPSPGQAMMRRALRHRGLIFGALVMGTIIFVAVCAPLLTRFSPYDQDLLQRMQPPVFLGGEEAHWLGTDALGRDFWARLAHGAHISLLIGIFAATISAVIGSQFTRKPGVTGTAKDVVAARHALAAAHPLTMAQRLPFPYAFACPAGVMRENGRNSGTTEAFSPWGDGVAAD